MLIKVTTTLGDAVDRLTILQIKHDKRMPINTEIYMELLVYRGTDGYKELLAENKLLWDLEDSIREGHSTQKGPFEFHVTRRIRELSLQIIQGNKRRAEIKAQIDKRSGVTPEPKNYFEP